MPRKSSIKKNEKYGRLKTLKKTNKKSNNNYLWECICDCGKIIYVVGYNLKSGNTSSCGCLHTEIRKELLKTHGKRNTKLYNVWLNMRQRCNNKNNPAYKNYGFINIKVCKQWDESFVSFYEWAIKNGYNKNLKIERINNNKGYYPINCKWATDIEQSRNKKSNIKIKIKNEEKTAKEWCVINNIKYQTAMSRIKRGWDKRKAVTEKPLKTMKG